MGTRCACVSMGGGPMPPTGSGSGPMPPTGSGPNPPTGSGSGSGPQPPTGSASSTSKPETTTTSYEWTASDFLVSSTDGEDTTERKGTEFDPWKTLTYAVQRIRTIRNANNPPSAENSATIHLTGGIHYLQETVSLNSRDAFLTITNYKGEHVTISGGIPLDLAWQQTGDIRHGEYEGICGDLYYGDIRHG